MSGWAQCRSQRGPSARKKNKMRDRKKHDRKKKKKLEWEGDASSYKFDVSLI